MYTAVKTDEARHILDSLAGTFGTPKAALTAARKAFGKAGALQFVKSKLVLM